MDVFRENAQITEGQPKGPSIGRSKEIGIKANAEGKKGGRPSVLPGLMRRDTPFPLTFHCDFVALR
jgi:hypothetical protein